MSKWCPSCRQEWPDERETCGACMAQLVGSLDATVVCRHCGTVAPARMHSCPSCLGELRLDPERVNDALAKVVASGLRLARPADVPPFAAGPGCTLLRAAARASLVFVGPNELMEATVEGIDHRAIPPLRCVDFDGTLLFRLTTYPALADALVAVGRDGASLGTYVRVDVPIGRDRASTAPGLHVRDETSAPVATLRPAGRTGAGFELVETGGGVAATCARFDADLDGWIDDQWSLRAPGELPLQAMGAVAMVLAAKVLLGRPSPVQVQELPEPGEDERQRGWGLSTDSPWWSGD